MDQSAAYRVMIAGIINALNILDIMDGLAASVFLRCAHFISRVNPEWKHDDYHSPWR